MEQRCGLIRNRMHKFEVTYITKVCQKLRLLDAPIEFLNE
jgi:hypothetical protein